MTEDRSAKFVRSVQNLGTSLDEDPPIVSVVLRAASRELTGHLLAAILTPTNSALSPNDLARRPRRACRRPFHVARRRAGVKRVQDHCEATVDTLLAGSRSCGCAVASQSIGCCGYAAQAECPLHPRRRHGLLRRGML